MFTRGGTRVDTVNEVRIDRSRVALTVSSQPVSLTWLWRAVRRARRGGVVLVHYPNVLAVLVLPFLRRGTRVVTYWHSDVINKGALGRLVGIAERYLLRRSDLVLASTRAYADASGRLHTVRDKVDVLPIGIEDVTRESKVPPALLPSAIQSFIGSHGRVVLAVGRLVPYKGFDVLVQAAATMPADTRLVIVGEGPEAGALRLQIESLGVADRVLLVGRLDDLALRALFQVASVYAMSSVERSEAYAIVQVEAMAHGVPIVATDIPGSGVPDVSGYGDTGALVPVGDPQALSAALTAVMSTADAGLRQRVRARFERYFTLDHMVNDALRLLFCTPGPARPS